MSESRPEIIITDEHRAMAAEVLHNLPFAKLIGMRLTELELDHAVIKIDMRDVRKDKTAKQELLQGGGQFQVPCLRITGAAKADQWLYESSDINDYLSQRFSN